MGKASRNKRNRQINQAPCARGAGRATVAKQSGADDPLFVPSSNGARFDVFVNGIRISGHALVLGCLVEGNHQFLARVEEGANTLGKSCVDLLFTATATGTDFDILGVAVVLEAQACLELLTMWAGSQEKNEMLERHLRHLLSCAVADRHGFPSVFAREHLKDHFARSRKRGEENIGALVETSNLMGFGREAQLLLGEIKAEALADFERQALEALLAPRVKTTRAAHSLRTFKEAHE